MLTKRLFIAAFGLLTLVLGACTPGATPQLIGSFPRDGQGQPPPASGPAVPTLTLNYHAAVTLEVEDVSYAAVSLQALAREQGGYVLSSASWYRDGDQFTEITLAVPVARFELVRSRIRYLGVVVSESVSGEITAHSEYSNDQPAFSNITVTLHPASARWSHKLMAFLGQAGTALFLLCPPTLMAIGLWTVIRWFGARLGVREQAG